MSTVTRAELSKRNEWWLPKHRYYELKHFCMQYPEWKQARNEIRSLRVSDPIRMLEASRSFGRPTETIAERMTYFDRRIEMVERAAELTDACIGSYILLAVIRGVSYDVLYTTKPIPCCREIYYELYRKFFYILSGLRE